MVLGGLGSGQSPILVRTSPSMGGARPDVRSALGLRQQSTYCGFGTWASLAPGLYDVVVYAWSDVTASFSNAQVVRVIVQ
jgi:hypothetical protein